jgi:hypothetical protein
MIESIALAVIIGGLLFVAGWRLRYRRVVSAIFARGDLLDLAPVHELLEQVNRESPKFTFTACRAIFIPVKGRMVQLVEGKAGHVVFGIRNPFWQSDRCLFAIAEAKDVDWFSEHEDAFRSAVQGSRCSVYWVVPGRV